MKIVHTSLSIFCGLVLTACGGGGGSSSSTTSNSINYFSLNNGNASSKELNTTPFERDVNHINHFQLELSKALSVDATIDYYTVDGTAIAGEDYIATSGTITIPAGETSVLIGVEIIGDSVVENNETFSLVVHNPINGEFANGVTELKAEHTIVNDDSTTNVVDRTLETATNILTIMIEGIRPVISIENLTTIPEKNLTDAFLINKNNETLDCTSSGQFTYTFNDNNADKAYSTQGDQFSLNANQCNDNSTTSHGDYSLLINSDNTIALTQEIRNTQVTLTNFMITDSNGSNTFNGVLTLDYNHILSNSNKEIQVSSTQLSLVGNNNSDFSNLSAIKSINEDTNEQHINTYNANLALSNSSYNGNYQVSVPSALKITNFEQYPYAGQLKVQRSSDNLIAYATAIDASTVRITADRNGDGSVEYSQDVPWTSISNGLK